MLRTSKTSFALRPARAVSDTVGPVPRSIAAQGAPIVDRAARFAVIGLALAGVLPPLAFTAKPGGLGQIGGVPISLALIGLLILAPALVGLVTALFGLEAVRENFRVRGDREHEQAVLRIFAGTLLLAYAFMMAALAPGDEAAVACQIIAALGLAAGWMFLLLAILDPVPSPLRHYLTTIADAALLSAFLHFGTGLAAPWYPLYLLVAFYAGFRFGPVALLASALVNLIGFGAVVALTPFWQHEGLLAVGLIVALILLPIYVASMVRAVAASRAEAAAARAARTHFLMVISQALRAPLDAFIGSSAASERGHPDREPEAPAVVPSARALLSQLNHILDFSAIEAGAFVPSTEPFDLHAVVNDTLAEHRAEAAAKGVRLRLQLDPNLPYRLRGWPQQLAQILDYLVARALEVTEEGTVRVSLDTVGGDDQAVRLRLCVRDEGAAIAGGEAERMFDPFAGYTGDPPPLGEAPAGAGGHGAFGLAVVQRLVELMGGQITVGSGTDKGGRFTILLPLSIDIPAIDSELDLNHCLVLIASEDSQFASDVAEPLNAWHADARWIGGFDAALDYVERLDSSTGAVLIIDGRGRAVAALSFTHRAAAAHAVAPLMLFVAEASQIDGIVELADGELDGVLPAPLAHQLLANALHALPLERTPSSRREAPAVTTPSYAAIADSLDGGSDPAVPWAASATPQVTPITAHPRFAADAPTVDARAVAALRGLGGGDDFLAEVIDSFRADAKEIMQRIVRAAAAADNAGFARGLHALRSSAGNLGGTRLCELLLSLREVSARELREHGSLLVQRLGDELARLDAGLLDFIDERRVGAR